MPFGIPRGAMCVQRLDDSLNSAIHINYRVSLRSSSMREPRDPLLKVLIFIRKFWFRLDFLNKSLVCVPPVGWHERQSHHHGYRSYKGFLVHSGFKTLREQRVCYHNDPSAGSPTETLLRLLLPLNDQVWPTFRFWVVVADLPEPVRRSHWAIQSVVATGGVYKGQGRNQRELMTRAY